MEAVEKYKIKEKLERDNKDKLLAKKERLKNLKQSISRKNNSIMVVNECDKDHALNLFKEPKPSELLQPDKIEMALLSYKPESTECKSIVDNEKSKYNYEEAEGTIKLKEEASYDEEYSE